MDPKTDKVAEPLGMPTPAPSNEVTKMPEGTFSIGGIASRNKNSQQALEDFYNRMGATGQTSGFLFPLA